MLNPKGRTSVKEAPVAAQVRATLPVLGGISGVNSTTWGMGLAAGGQRGGQLVQGQGLAIEHEPALPAEGCRFPG